MKLEINNEKPSEIRTECLVVAVTELQRQLGDLLDEAALLLL